MKIADMNELEQVVNKIIQTIENNSKPESWLTTEQVCETLQISETTLMRWRKAGKIKYYKIPQTDTIRYKLSELLEAQ